MVCNSLVVLASNSEKSNSGKLTGTLDTPLIVVIN